MNLIPQVHRKDGMEDFKASLIYKSLLRETSLTELQAREICLLTVRRIVSNKIEFLSGPHIREIVCSVLAEEGYYKERLQYTRIGIPFYDCKEYVRNIRGVGIHVLKEYIEVKKRISELEVEK